MDAVVAQLVRAPVCGTGGRWFEPTQLYQQINDLDRLPRFFALFLLSVQKACPTKSGRKYRTQEENVRAGGVL